MTRDWIRDAIAHRDAVARALPVAPDLDDEIDRSIREADGTRVLRRIDRPAKDDEPDALGLRHGRIHRDPGRARAARTVRAEGGAMMSTPCPCGAEPGQVHFGGCPERSEYSVIDEMVIDNPLAVIAHIRSCQDAAEAGILESLTERGVVLGTPLPRTASAEEQDAHLREQMRAQKARIKELRGAS